MLRGQEGEDRQVSMGGSHMGVPGDHEGSHLGGDGIRMA